MIQRRINERDVLDTLESPDDVIDGDMGETIAVRRLR